MSNYRRLISYIYAYEGGVKGKNIGFAKIESRNGQCKIGVNVKKVYVGSNDMGVYLLNGNEEIFLGKIFIRNGVGEFRTVVPFNDIEQTGNSMDQCIGMTVHDTENTWQSYTTIWEDAVAHAAEIELAEVTSENRTKEELNSQEQDTVIREPDQHLREVVEEIETEISTEQAVKQETAQYGPVMEEAVPVIHEEKKEEETAIIGNPQELERLQQEERAEMEEGGHQLMWDQFRREHAKIQAFDYENGCEILSIKPQDIGLLPRETWTYGNNSFLLHGYYNYRYLLLAKLNNPQGPPRYLLGVPGHYYSNEKYMASMFGFPGFVLSKMQPTDDGRFGYWYTDVKLGN